MMGTRAFAMAVLLAPALAAAQPPPTPQAKAAASDKVKKAIAKSQAGDHEAAVDLYLEAYAIIPQPLLLSNVGSEYQQMDKPVEALKYFCKYLDADPTGSNVTYANAQARTLYIELGGITTVEDKDLCKPIKKPKKEEPPPPPPRGGNDEPSSGGTEEGQTDKVTTKQTPPLRYVGIGLTVVGAGVFGAGVYFGLQAKKISDEITNHDINKPWDSNIKQKEAEGKSAEQKQIGLMIGGGLALAAGTLMFVLAKPKEVEGSSSVSVVPVATPDTLGFAASGRF